MTTIAILRQQYFRGQWPQVARRTLRGHSKISLISLRDHPEQIKEHPENSEHWLHFTWSQKRYHYHTDAEKITVATKKEENFHEKIPKRETLGPFDWDLMGSNWCSREKGWKTEVHHLWSCSASPAVHHLSWCITDSSTIIIFDILES